MDHQLEEPELRSYLGVVARRKRWVAGVAAVFFAVAVAMSVVPDPMYKAEATVLTSNGTNLAVLAMGGTTVNNDLNREADNHASRIEGLAMRGKVQNAIPKSLDPNDVLRVKVEPVTRTPDPNRISSVVRLSLTSTDPDKAAQLLNLYASTYVSEWRSRNAETYSLAMAQLSKARVSAETQIAEVEGQADGLRAQRDSSGSELQREQLQLQIDEIEDATLPALWENKNFFQRRLEMLQFGMGFDIGNAEIVAPAMAPRAPVSPNVPLNLAIGLTFGLFLGIAVAFVRDYFDDSVKSKEIVEQVTGVPALGLIPKFATSESELVTASSPSAPAAEAFRSLRTSVKFLSVDRDIRVLQITSPSAGEGKTVTAVNLAAVFAQAGDRVVLVGADMRRPRAEEVLGVSLTPGLTGVLIGEVALPQAIRSVDGLPNLSVLPAGYPPPNPSELLSGERARRLVDVLAQTYDVVVLDCPPVLPVSDALVLAAMSDATLLVTSGNRTSRRSLDRCVEVLQQVQAPLVGTVMTSLAPGETFGGGPYSYDGLSSGRYTTSKRASGGNGYVGTGPGGNYTPDPAGTGQMQHGPATTPTQTLQPMPQPQQDSGDHWPGPSD